MRYLKRLGVVASVAVMASLSMAGSASAALDERAVCQLTGVAGDITPGVMLTPNSGFYTFEGSVNCTYSIGNATFSDVGTIVSAGSFSNIVCGTGSATSTPGTTSVTFPSGSPIPNVNNVNYQIQFTAAQGALQITSATDSHNHSGSGGGEVTIIPSEGGCEQAGGVTAFDVLGGFALVTN